VFSWSFPGIAPREVSERLNAHSFPGAKYLPVTFRPTFQKHAGQSCGGVFVGVYHPDPFRSVKSGLLVLMTFRELLGEQLMLVLLLARAIRVPANQQCDCAKQHRIDVLGTRQTRAHWFTTEYRRQNGDSSQCRDQNSNAPPVVQRGDNDRQVVEVNRDFAPLTRSWRTLLDYSYHEDAG
jgi:uncharacterized protein YbbC (DUF1343 family)